MYRLAIAAALCAAGCQQQPQAPPKPSQLAFEGASSTSNAAMVAHGRRLAEILDCTGCHGPGLQGRDLADKPADGAMYSPNVTLIVPTYSDSELDRFIRHGVPKNHRQFWFMQVENYQFLSDPDFKALVAYLRSLKPAGKALPAFKLNRVEAKDVEQGLLGDAQAQIRKYRAGQPVDLGPDHAWGRYMVMTTCTACHNNELQGWTNFTPNLDIAGAYSKAELTRLLTTGEGKTRKELKTMSGMGRDHFSHLTGREREAIVDYILARANRPQPAAD
ncbi:MAG TPA: c-type cytochrome [Sphingomicrobium sp.]|nr:c-type cytochrome [Sphingomicrobium sp.]